MSGATLGSGLVCSFCSRGQHDRCTVCVCAVCFPVYPPPPTATVAEARQVLADAGRGVWRWHPQKLALDLCRTVVQQSEQIATLNELVRVVAMDHGDLCDSPDDCACSIAQVVRRARALGVAE